LIIGGLLVALAMGMLSARIAGADPAPAVIELRKNEAALLRASAERGALEQKLAGLTQQIEVAKKSGGGELERLMASSQELSRTLAALAARVRALDGTLAAQRRALIESIDAELGGSVTEQRRTELLALRKETLERAAATARVTIAQPRVGKLDDPADLAEKAALLAASERKLRAQAGVLARRAAGMDKRLKLRRASERAENNDLFADDSPRRRAATAGETRKVNTGGGQNSPNAAARDDDNGETADFAAAPAPGVQSPAPPAGTPAQTNQDPVANGGQPTAPQGTANPLPAARTPRDADVDLAGDPSVVLVDVLDPATLAELRTAQRTGDPARQISALRRAEASLRALADDLAKRQAAMKKRAADLRKQK